MSTPTLIANGRSVPIATIRPHIGQRVRWELRGQTMRTLYYPGRSGVGILEKAIGRNLCVSGEWLWRPDVLTLELAPPQSVTSS